MSVNLNFGTSTMSVIGWQQQNINFNGAKFFFDTADAGYIKTVYEKLLENNPNKEGLVRAAIAGVTTNPNALSKVHATSISEMELVIFRLDRFLSKLNTTGTEVHVQLPNSSMQKISEINFWVEYISQITKKLIVKIPPFVQTLKMFENIDVNVTGVTESATAARCFTYPCVKYVSILSGRMEEKGIDADAHLNFLHTMVKRNKMIIAGSMRTVDGVRRAIRYGAVPTIGARVWDSMTNDDYADFLNWWDDKDQGESNHFSSIPLTDERNIELTKSFFEEMDRLGMPIYTEFFPISGR